MPRVSADDVLHHALQALWCAPDGQAVIVQGSPLQAGHRNMHGIGKHYVVPLARSTPPKLLHLQFAEEVGRVGVERLAIPFPILRITERGKAFVDAKDMVLDPRQPSTRSIVEARK